MSKSNLCMVLGFVILLTSLGYGSCNSFGASKDMDSVNHVQKRATVKFNNGRFLDAVEDYAAGALFLGLIWLVKVIYKRYCLPAPTQPAENEMTTAPQPSAETEFTLSVDLDDVV